MHNGKIVSDTKHVKVSQLVGATNDESLKKELQTCKDFLEDFEVKIGKQWVFKIAMELLGSHLVSEKLWKSAREAQVRRKIECWLLLCAKTSERWMLWVLQCTREQYFDGLI